MSAKLVFRCDHEGCEAEYTIDTSAPHKCGAPNGVGAVEPVMPLNLSPVVNFLTDKPENGGGGWEFACADNDGLLLFVKCFCPAHADDVRAMPGYERERLPVVPRISSGSPRRRR